MNHEFEWRNRMRELGGTVEPTRDLWPAIAARIAGGASAPVRSRRRVGAWLAMAATLVAAVGAGSVAWRAQHSAPARHPQAQPAVATAVPRADELPPTALGWALPADPALAASARKLDDASAQLQHALEQRPDAVFLVGLLNRTNAQRLRLMRKSPYSD